MITIVIQVVMFAVKVVKTLRASMSQREKARAAREKKR